MRDPDEEAGWIGIDVGATSVKACRVALPPAGGDGLRPAEWVERPASEGGGDERAFRPRPLEEQLAEAGRGMPHLGPRECEAAEARVAAIVAVVRDLVGPDGRARLALCAAGRTDSARRGLVAVRNGPRAPRLLDDVAGALRRTGLTGLTGLELPAAIHSDGAAAALGELKGAGGALRGARNAYVVGCGTGVAEAVLRAGVPLEPAAICPGWTPAWAAPDGEVPAEERLAMPGLLGRWRALRGPGAPEHPEAAARAGDPAARELLDAFARSLAEFVASRLASLERAGLGVERVVVGQRAAALLADPALDACFGAPLRAGLARPVVPATSRAAAAVGAVALALQAQDAEGVSA